MPKRAYIQALVCYLAIPAVVIASGVLFRLIDPEMARGTADYVRNYHIFELLRTGTVWSAMALVVVLWTACCFLVLESRQRALPWLVLAAGGPLGFTFIAMLADKAPLPEDLYQHFLKSLKIYWRLALEIAMFVAVWTLAYEAVMLKHDLMVAFESFRTGTPVAAIIAEQNASGGMWAFSEGLQVMYLVALIYLLWPLLFNWTARLRRPRAA